MKKSILTMIVNIFSRRKKTNCMSDAIQREIWEQSRPRSDWAVGMFEQEKKKNNFIRMRIWAQYYKQALRQEINLRIIKIQESEVYRKREKEELIEQLNTEWYMMADSLLRKIPKEHIDDNENVERVVMPHELLLT
jgi:hypothetical protein